MVRVILPKILHKHTNLASDFFKLATYLTMVYQKVAYSKGLHSYSRESDELEIHPIRNQLRTMRIGDLSSPLMNTLRYLDDRDSQPWGHS